MDRLLPSKLEIPHPSREPISRPRVRELLSGALQARLVLVSAPPGFGKSTALIDWLAGSEIRGSWISLDETDNDPARFLRYLWAGVSKLATDDGSQATEAGSHGDPVEVAGELAALLAERPEPSVLVLDDYHAVTAPTVQRAVARFLDCLPPQAHLVIASRIDPVLPLARLRAQGELLELRADALRFTPDEARTFLSERMGVVLGDDDLETLMTRTEGWPAVLQLAGLSLGGRPDVSRRVRDFAASHRFVLDYITDEVLARLEPEEREFLLRTSVLDRLTGPLCDALWGRSGGQEMLERLERANVLLIPLDEERGWYRYHHLFAQLLRARLAAANPDLPSVLELRASDWYAEHGFAGEAIEHAIRSGDVERAVSQIAACGGVLIHAGELITLLGMMDRLPEPAVRSHFRLSTFYALSLALSGQTEGVESRLADSEEALPAVAAGLPGAAVQASYHALVRSIAARIRRDGPAAVRHAERALALAPPGAAPLLADIRGTLGLALLDVGDVDRAIDELRAARPALRASGNWIALADSTRDLARAQARRGQLQAALDACDEVLAEFVDLDGNEMPAAARIHLARAQILQQLGDSHAVDTVEHAAALARRGGDATTLRDARALLERTRARAGAHSSATMLVEPLTHRELEVLRLVALGRSNRQIAAELFVTVGTVKSHVNSISGKLGAANRVEAIARARGLGLLV